jgi:hypothetical protein
MNISFTADSYYNDVEDDVLIVGLYGEGHLLRIQLAVPPVSDHLPEVIQTYLVERDNSAYSTRSGIESLVLHKEELEIHLTEDGKKELQCDGIFVHFDLDPMAFLELKIALFRIFEDKMHVED